MYNRCTVDSLLTQFRFFSLNFVSVKNFMFDMLTNHECFFVKVNEKQFKFLLSKLKVI